MRIFSILKLLYMQFMSHYNWIWLPFNAAINTSCWEVSNLLLEKDISFFDLKIYIYEFHWIFDELFICIAWCEIQSVLCYLDMTSSTSHVTNIIWICFVDFISLWENKRLFFFGEIKQCINRHKSNSMNDHRR